MGEDLAPNDNSELGTSGDLDTKTEECVTYIDVNIGTPGPTSPLPPTPTPPTPTAPTPVTGSPTTAPTATLMISVVEDVMRNIGEDILSTIEPTLPEDLDSITVRGFPEGTVLTVSDGMGGNMTITAGPMGATIPLTGDRETILGRLRSISILEAPNSDEDYPLEISVGRIGSMDDTILNVPVQVLAVADDPSVSANPVEVLDRTCTPVEIFADRSVDEDSEILTVEIEIATDSTGQPIGTLELTDPGNVNTAVSFMLLGDNTYLVNATGATAEAREMALDSVLSSGGLCFRPTNGVSGDFASGMCVTAISTETGKCMYLM